jgi:uncharacterized protein YegJ (DUF2314 family)
MRDVVVGAAALAVVCLGVVQVAKSRTDQTLERAIVANKTVPKSADERHVINDNVVAYTTKNEALLAARKKARETLPRFVGLMNSGMKATFTVKFPLTQDGHTEHIWLQVADMQHGNFIGRLANAPVNGTQYMMGQFMTVAAADVEDWMVRTPDGIYGGYTARYALKDLPKQQAEQLAGLFRD